LDLARCFESASECLGVDSPQSSPYRQLLQVALLGEDLSKDERIAHNCLASEPQKACCLLFSLQNVSHGSRTALFAVEVPLLLACADHESLHGFLFQGLQELLQAGLYHFQVALEVAVD